MGEVASRKFVGRRLMATLCVGTWIGGLVAAAWAAEKLPPLTVDKSAPLLLDAPGEKSAGKAKEPSSLNQACFVCHNNYTEEQMVTVHAKEKVGCIDCHGPSFAHRDDEDNVTPPDIMYPLDKIDVACQKCHETHDAPAKKVLTRWQERCPGKKDFATVVCTDCHGQHRLEKRVVRWDKKTRQLLLSAKPIPTAPGEATGSSATKAEN
jgi:hypothetical protein